MLLAILILWRLGPHWTGQESRKNQQGDVAF